MNEGKSRLEVVVVGDDASVAQFKEAFECLLEMARARKRLSYWVFFKPVKKHGAHLFDKQGIPAKRC